jgi:hypothetical protein
MDTPVQKSEIESLYHAWMVQLSQELPNGIPQELQTLSQNVVIAHLAKIEAEQCVLYQDAINNAKNFQQENSQ